MEREILAVLDGCCEKFTFPMLDNGYVYLAATRLSLFRSTDDWAMVIEVFGFSPRSELPDTHIHTFASRLHDRNPPSKYVNPKAYASYLATNPHNESRFVHPIGAGPWQDSDNGEVLAPDATGLRLRGRPFALPARSEYARHGITLEDAANVWVYDLCRYLAAVARDQVLATPAERRISVPPDLEQILQLEEWHHPDVCRDERPSASPTFQQLARVLVTGDPREYRPRRPPNTHWSNWPDGGSL
jgi:hypothetical protein